MNFTRLALAAAAAFVSYFIVGGIGFVAFPSMKADFEKHAAVFRPKEQLNSVMPIGMLGTLLAIVTATAIFARIHPAGAGLMSGLEFGVALAAFVIGSFVLHNHMLLNISRRLTATMAVAYAAEWVAVGVAISLVYRG
jgi:hypothetical protein